MISVLTRGERIDHGHTQRQHYQGLLLESEERWRATCMVLRDRSAGKCCCSPDCAVIVSLSIGYVID